MPATTAEEYRLADLLAKFMDRERIEKDTDP